MDEYNTYPQVYPHFPGWYDVDVGNVEYIPQPFYWDGKSWSTQFNRVPVTSKTIRWKPQYKHDYTQDAVSPKTRQPGYYNCKTSSGMTLNLYWNGAEWLTYFCREDINEIKVLV